MVLVPYVLLEDSGHLMSGMRSFFRFPMLLVVLALGIAVHELIHGLSWQLLNAGKKSAVVYGFQWKTLTPYAHITEATTAKTYRLGTAAPGIILGALPLMLGLIINDGWLIWFGTLFTMAAGGDALILWKLRGTPSSALVEDHPTKPGCIVHIPIVEPFDAAQ